MADCRHGPLRFPLATGPVRSTLLAAMRAGARGCVHADAGPAEVARAARGVAVGEVIFGPELAARLGELVAADKSFRAPDRTVAISRAMAATLIR